MILEFARSQPYQPARNPKGDVTSTTWLLLLDALDRDVAVVGHVGEVTSAALERMFGDRRGEVAHAGLVVVGPDVDRPDAGPTRPDAYVYCWTDAVVDADLRPASEDAGDHLARDVASIGLPPPSPPPTLVSRVAARLGGRTRSRGSSTLGLGAPAETVVRRRPVLMVPPGGDPALVPHYIRDIAEAAGVDLSTSRWRLMADADYFSQKAIFFIDASVAGALAIKVTRDPAFSSRLRNEHDGLTHLSRTGWGAAHRPASVFCGEHAGLAIVAEEAVPGVPFVERWSGAPDDPLFVAATDALASLAGATAAPGSGTEMAEAIGEVAGAYERLVAPPRAVVDGLHRDLDAIAAAPALPVVALHGDCGPWNLVVRPSGAVAFLDWENFERAAPPLWDVAFLVEGACATAVRRARRRYSAAAFKRRLWSDGRWRERMGTTARSIAATLDVDHAVVDPLLRTALMHLALKEATRLPAGGGGVHAAIAAMVLAERAPFA